MKDDILSSAVEAINDVSKFCVGTSLVHRRPTYVVREVAGDAFVKAHSFHEHKEEADNEAKRLRNEALARAVIALTLKAAAGEVEAWSHNSTGTRDPEQAMQEAAQDTLAEKIADRFLSLAAQVEKPNG